jgi:hypothetical protein
MTKMTAQDMKFKSDRERVLMEVTLAKFADFAKREQHEYLLNGMSTSHVVVSVMKRFNDHLTKFWPAELIRHRIGYALTYQLEDDVFERVQTNIRNSLDKLAKAGYLEKVGNEDERRWKPVKALRGVTL